MSHKLILLAEDNIVNQKVATRQLQKLGYRADVVANGREAIEALSRISYDLVFMDCQMPEMDGYKATVEIRRLEGEKKHTPIIAMTAHALEGEREKCIASGMDDYLSKPVKIEELFRLLELFLSGEIEEARDRTIESYPPVDVKRLHDAMGDEPEEYTEILNIYLDSMSENLVNLDAAMSALDHRQVELIAHNCAGTSANCGMTAVVAPLRRLEEESREGKLENAPALVAQTKFEFDRVCEFVKDFTLQPA